MVCVSGWLMCVGLVKVGQEGRTEWHFEGFGTLVGELLLYSVYIYAGWLRR